MHTVEPQQIFYLSRTRTSVCAACARQFHSQEETVTFPVLPGAVFTCSDCKQIVTLQPLTVEDGVTLQDFARLLCRLWELGRMPTGDYCAAQLVCHRITEILRGESLGDTLEVTIGAPRVSREVMPRQWARETVRKILNDPQAMALLGLQAA